MLKYLYDIFTGPRLFHIKEIDSSISYVGNSFETFSDSPIRLISGSFWYLKSIWYISLPYLYWRGYFTQSGLHYVLNWSQFFIMIYAVAFLTRGFGRMFNPVYLKFLREYQNEEFSKKYNYEFRYHPPQRKASLHDRFKDFEFKPLKFVEKSQLNFFKSPQYFLHDIFGYCAMKFLGQRMVFPGSISLLNLAIADQLTESRLNLINTNKAQRYKLTSEVDDHIDTLFVDKRDSSLSNYKGNKIVICAEGNGGYYEVGNLKIALEAGYSVIGWNHPGFGGSTGTATAITDALAIDAVYKFVLLELNFQPRDIILFSWSIGGYATSWLAYNYPDISACIFDAPFDDLASLAIYKMPISLSIMVERTIQYLMHMPVDVHLAEYPGTLKFIRRLSDEVITTERHVLLSNRINDLVMNVLSKRYPNLFNEDNEDLVLEILDKPLENRLIPLEFKELCLSQFYREQFPSPLSVQMLKTISSNASRDLIYGMLNLYLFDFNATHCTPLTSNFLEL